MWRLLLLALPALVVVSGSAEGPRFLPTRRAVAAAPGADAELACRVARLGDTAVSWVRARDLQILAHAGAAFSADPRVGVAVAAAGSGGGGVTHTLRLARVRLADAGRYECQLNTDPKLSQFFDLIVTDAPQPRLEVLARPAGPVRALAGGAATLGCEARLLHAPAAAGAAALSVAWYHEGEMLQAHGGRAGQGGVSLETERRADGASARLTLAALAARDAGRYTCRVGAAGGALAAEASVALLLAHAEAGEMEAMQRDEGGARGEASAAPGPPYPARAGLAPAAALAALLVAAQARL